MTQVYFIREFRESCDKCLSVRQYCCKFLCRSRCKKVISLQAFWGTFLAWGLILDVRILRQKTSDSDV